MPLVVGFDRQPATDRTTLAFSVLAHMRVFPIPKQPRAGRCNASRRRDRPRSSPAAPAGRNRGDDWALGPGGRRRRLYNRARWSVLSLASVSSSWSASPTGTASRWLTHAALVGVASRVAGFRQSAVASAAIAACAFVLAAIALAAHALPQATRPDLRGDSPSRLCPTVCNRHGRRFASPLRSAIPTRNMPTERSATRCWRGEYRITRYRTECRANPLQIRCSAAFSCQRFAAYAVRCFTTERRPPRRSIALVAQHTDCPACRLLLSPETERTSTDPPVRA